MSAPMVLRVTHAIYGAVRPRSRSDDSQTALDSGFPALAKWLLRRSHSWEAVNTVQVSLMMRMYELNTSQAVRTTFYNALRLMHSFVAYFEHVGIR
eukprot:scaffold1870_cov73-Cyclotella_meneghiniana.AAC.2